VSDSDRVQVHISNGLVTINIPAERMFHLMEGKIRSYSWTEDWWQRRVSPVVYDAMAAAIVTGTGNSEGNVL
jgi:hypothetical protein